MLNSQQKMELVDLLAACPLMQDRATRDLVVQELPFWEKIKRDSRDRFDMIGIVNTCLAHRNGIDQLLQAMRLYEGKLLTLPFEAVLAKWDEFQQANQPKVEPPPVVISTPQQVIKAEPIPDISRPPKKTPEPTPRPIITSPRPKIEFDWVTIPAGEFWMGSNDRDDEKPMHKVYLPEYKIARVPVTNEQWGVFLQDSGYNWVKRRNDLWKDGLPRGKEKHPVVYVTWHDAMAFCQWAGGRLPTEAEWEKAARGTDRRKYPWGNNQPNASLCNFSGNVGDTIQVGNYLLGQSPYGCLDMAGNVWEWCLSQYKAYPYKANDGRENINFSNIYRVLRGGSWGDESISLRCACRDFSIPDIDFYYEGFRCVCVTVY